MTDRRARMIEDRYLRDSARALVEADIKYLKADVAFKGIGSRAVDRVRDSAYEFYDEAIDVAENNKGALAALLAAVVVWFARNPILALFGLGEEADDEGPESDEAAEL